MPVALVTAAAAALLVGEAEGLVLGYDTACKSHRRHCIEAVTDRIFHIHKLTEHKALEGFLSMEAPGAPQPTHQANQDPNTRLNNYSISIHK